MEPDIHSSLPEGSPLLAYGTSREARWKNTTWLLAVGAAALLVFSLIVGALVLATRTVEIPQHTVLLAAAPSQTSLPLGFPRVWREAAAAQSFFPLLLGIAEIDGVYLPFALIPEASWKNGFFRLTSEKPLATSPISLYRTVSFLVRASDSSPYLEIRNPKTEIQTPSLFTGSIQDTTWQTSTELPQTSPLDLPMQDLAVNIRVFPESWLSMAQALEEHVAGISMIDQPDTVGWSDLGEGKISLTLTYEHGVPTSTRVVLSSAVEDLPTRSYHLPDDTVVEELLPPTEISASSTIAAPLSFTEHSVTLGEPAIAADDEACGEHLLARLRGEALTDLIERTNLPFTLSPATTLLIGETKGRMLVCWK